MLKNYFIVAWRNLTKNRVYSAINILGLAAGMAVALLIGLWIWDEVSYNQNFDNYNRVVRVMENSTHGSQKSTFNSVPIPLSVELHTTYAADFRRVSMGSWNVSHALAFGDKQIIKNGMYVQPDFLPMFSVRLIAGSMASLNDPRSMILSRTLATTIFGNDDPIGKTIKVDNRSSLKVTGIYEDFPHNCEFGDTYALMAWDGYVADWDWVKNSQTNWDNNSWQLYAQLQDHADLKAVSAKVKRGLEGHDRKDKPEVVLHPMSKWRLYSEFKNGVNIGGAIQFVNMFAVVGIFVLLLACINFMNLSTARSEKRAKEVGIRKAIGSLHRQLVGQFLGESMLITFVSFCLALLIVQLALPFFNELADKQMNIFWDKPLFWLSAIGFIVITGFIAGSYPAFYLSSFNSVSVLKGTFKAGRFASIPRKVLVVLQFTVSVSLIIATLVVFRQIEYAKDRPIGYDREGLLTIGINTPDLYAHYGTLRNDLLSSGAIEDITESGSPTTAVYSGQSGFDWPGKDPNLNPTFAVIPVTHDFGKTVGWQFKEGRDFSRDFATDSAGMVLNETAVKYMGLKEPVVGQTVKYLYSSRTDKNFRILGVIKDMVMESPFEPVKQTVFLMDTSSVGMNIITLRINRNIGAARALPAIAAIFKRYNPGTPFDYTFNDKDYEKKFDFEQRIGSLASVFTAFAIFISCLGLFGLAAFMAEQRTKEIGVRKVLGASVLHLWGLLSKEFLLLVSLSFVVAIPLSWYLMNGWLKQYDYRTTISAWIFLVTAAMALLITLITVSFQSIRASMANPARSLRSE
ncbi:ABC transporter permease [Puia dinghuensis]|uniref:ABC transporter permease n=1 Tax=Puia dinghuensis TaxID=1792502 RepID=A0A8J2UCK3_9BACT|nr:ABC transporter permease [Puia dinghuensis]GGA97132.1 ABC transporter permease [Puia dinghuensis]